MCLQAYVEELEKEVRRLVDDNLKLKKQCKEVPTQQLTNYQLISGHCQIVIYETAENYLTTATQSDLLLILIYLLRDA